MKETIEKAWENRELLKEKQTIKAIEAVIKKMIEDENVKLIYKLISESIIKTKNENILIDTSPDLRHQLLTNNIKNINYVLYSEVNPGLAAHGGEVSLIEVLDEEIAILQFGGGCQGCGMVDLTLKDGVEKTLLEQVDGLKSVRDVTDHSYRENAYYK